MDAELKSGSTLGPYELLTRLGKGGMASVWVARERVSTKGKQSLVAVKAMLPELAQNSEFRAMFLEEGQIVRNIDHPHVVKVHAVSEDKTKSILYMVMDWVEGDSLRAIIKEAKRRRAIPIEIAVKIIVDTARGLHAAHELQGWDGQLRNIVHCDISPHNILVGIDGLAKLVDFGVANATVHGAGAFEDKVKGKFGYMSPEQASAEKVDRRSDIFALGIVLFELTTGERLFRGESAAHSLELVRRAQVPKPSQIYPEYPEPLETIVLRALERDVWKRFQTAADFADALEQYLRDERILVSHAGVGQLVRRVLGTRIDQQRDAVQKALTARDGTLEEGLVSEPAASERSKTESPQTLDRPRPKKRASIAPLLAALAGIAAAGSAFYFTSHRHAPELVSQTMPNPKAGPPPTASTEASPPVLPGAVSVDSIPLAVQGMQLPAKEKVAPSTAGRARRANKSERVSLQSPKISLSDDPEPTVAEPAPGAGPAADSQSPSASTPAKPAAGPRSPLNHGAAFAALGAAASIATNCRRADGPTGSGTATVTFSPDGPATAVSISAPFAGTPVGACVSSVFRGVHVPPFSGGTVTLPKAFQIPP
jgi:eukaryotic-like serine/threonine-protein kinase